jgi:hypothetical protein
MSLVSGRRDNDCPQVPRALAEIAESVSAVMRSPLKAQAEEMSTLVERTTVPRAYCVT